MHHLNDFFPTAKSIVIKSISTDSREKMESGLFICSEGLVHDSHEYVDQAIANGAVAIVHSKPLKQYQDGIEYIKVESTEAIIHPLVNQYFNHPSENMRAVGVTGTNGKSTISLSIKHILNHFEKTGYIGTISIEYGNIKLPPVLTTPDIIPLQKTLADMVKAHVKSVIIETSSHGLAMGRVKGVSFDQGIFTNLTHDHLDYHGTMENYYTAKKRLFDDLKEDGAKIINIDDEYGARLAKETSGNVITYAIDKDATYRATKVQLNRDYSHYVLVHDGKEYSVKTNLVARFNVYNSLAIIASIHEMGYDFETFLPYLETVEPVDGRMEFINEGQNFVVLVDYAHTPDGFTKLYEYAKTITPKDKRIITVFGCAGKRDKSKRKILGSISDTYCDMIILTEEDNRNELVRDICEDIAVGIQDTPYIIVESRMDAIRQGIELADSDDTVVILGKGNEPYMYRDFGVEPYLGDNNVAIEVLNLYVKEGDDYNENE